MASSIKPLTKKILMKKIINRTLAFLLVGSLFALWQFSLYSRSNSIVDFLLEAGKSCKSGVSSMCSVLPATQRNLESNLSILITPLADRVGSHGRYDSAMTLMRDTEKLVDNEIRKNEAEARNIENIANTLKDAEKRRKDVEKEKEKEEANFHSEYDQLASPKLMYACDLKVAYIAAKGLSNYNDLLEEAKSDCPAGWTFKILRSDK